MQCPVCKTGILKKIQLEEELTAMSCESCVGIWLSSTSYFEWLKKHGPTFPEKPFAATDYEVKDTVEAKICPECHKILGKYKVGHGISFYLDHCSGCNGVWLDKNEWEVLKSRNLHDEIHRIFTTSWQYQVRREEIARKWRMCYEQKFGELDYARIREVREWIHAHAQCGLLLSYLTAEDPYQN